MLVYCLRLAVPPRLSLVHLSLLWRPSFLFSDIWDCLSHSLVSAVPLSVLCSTGFVVITFAYRTILLFLPQFDNSDGYSSLISIYFQEINLLFYAFWTCSIADKRPDCYFAISAFVNELKSFRLPCSFSFPCLCFGHLDYDMFWEILLQPCLFVALTASCVSASLSFSRFRELSAILINKIVHLFF